MSSLVFPDPQSWVASQMRTSHDEAVAHFGEYCFFILLWRVNDFEAGLVERCPTCWIAHGSIAEAFGQASDSKCASCFGTTFDGGYRAKIVRPSLWDYSEVDETKSRRGVVERQSASVQTGSDFRLNHGDWIIRADGSRWEIKSVSPSIVRTGFEHPTRGSNSVGMNLSGVTREDETMPVYLVPPTDPADVADALVYANPRWGVDLSDFEDIRGSLL
jgi:hypothetical protein